MSKYKGKPVVVGQSAADVYSKLSNLKAYQERLDSLPAEAREKLGQVRFTDDSIFLNAAPVGEICFKVVERQEPTLLRLEAQQSPVPCGIAVHTRPIDDSSAEVSSEIDIDIPMMLRPMVGGKLQEAADKFSEMLSLFFA